jgi:hypothetical protein
MLYEAYVDVLLGAVRDPPVMMILLGMSSRWMRASESLNHKL